MVWNHVRVAAVDGVGHNSPVPVRLRHDHMDKLTADWTKFSGSARSRSDWCYRLTLNKNNPTKTTHHVTLHVTLHVTHHVTHTSHTHVTHTHTHTLTINSAPQR